MMKAVPNEPIFGKRSIGRIARFAHAQAPLDDLFGDRFGGVGGKPTDPERLRLYLQAVQRAIPIPGGAHHIIDSEGDAHTTEDIRQAIAQEPYASALSDAFRRAFAEAQAVLGGLDSRYWNLKYLGFDLARGNRGLTVDRGVPYDVHFYPYGHLRPAVQKALLAGHANDFEWIRSVLAEDMADTVVHELSRAESFDPEGTPIFDAIKKENLRRTKQIFRNLTRQFEEALQDEPTFDRFASDAEQLGYFIDQPGSHGTTTPGWPPIFGERKATTPGATVGPEGSESGQGAARTAAGRRATEQQRRLGEST